MSAPAVRGDRLVTFEVAGGLYALPIAHVREVAEATRVCCVPTLPPSLGGVMNHHGDALPIVWPAALFEEVDGAPATESFEHVLVISQAADDTALLGLPVDRVVGLFEATPSAARAQGVVAERRPYKGRLLGVLDTARLVERAATVIEASVGGTDGAGGER